MPPRSKTELLPAALREELERRLLAKSFSGYRELSRWLAEQGYSITRAALHRYGRSFERRLKQVKLATAQARAIVDGAPDDDNRINEAMQMLIQQRLFEILVEVQGDELKEINLHALARSVAELGRAWVMQKKWKEETRAIVAGKVNAADEKISGVARNAGLTPETEDRIRKALLEIQV